MRHYDAEWRGIANYHAKTDALGAANAAWASAQQIDDTAVREAVDMWKQAIDLADMKYREGQQPPVDSDLHAAYRLAADQLARLLRLTQT